MARLPGRARLGFLEHRRPGRATRSSAVGRARSRIARAGASRPTRRAREPCATRCAWEPAGMSIAVAIFGLLLLVFIHELGHFIAAKASACARRGSTVGFPPAVVKRTRRRHRVRHRRRSRSAASCDRRACCAPEAGRSRPIVEDVLEQAQGRRPRTRPLRLAAELTDVAALPRPGPLRRRPLRRLADELEAALEADSRPVDSGAQLRRRQREPRRGSTRRRRSALLLARSTLAPAHRDHGRAVRQRDRLLRDPDSAVVLVRAAAVGRHDEGRPGRAHQVAGRRDRPAGRRSSSWP